jgi:hypothetical protein
MMMSLLLSQSKSLGSPILIGITTSRIVYHVPGIFVGSSFDLKRFFLWKPTTLYTVSEIKYWVLQDETRTPPMIN